MGKPKRKKSLTNKQLRRSRINDWCRAGSAKNKKDLEERDKFKRVKPSEIIE